MTPGAAEPKTLAEALAEIERLRALGDRMAGTLDLLAGPMHLAVGKSRSLHVDSRYYLCMIENPGQMDVLGEPVHAWLVSRGMKPDDLRREREFMAQKVARAR